LEPAKHRYRPDFAQRLAGNEREPLSPTGKIERAYTVRCPECGCTYVSENLRGVFGLLTIAQYRIAMFCLMVIVLAAILFGQ